MLKISDLITDALRAYVCGTGRRNAPCMPRLFSFIEMQPTANRTAKNDQFQSKLFRLTFWNFEVSKPINIHRIVNSHPKDLLRCFFYAR